MPRRRLLIVVALLLAGELEGARRRAVINPRVSNPAYLEGGYADRTSVAQGSVINFHIATSISPFEIRIVNLVDGRLMRTLGGLQSVARDCNERWETGCGWPVTASLAVPHDWPSGYYAGKFPTSLGERNVIFVVRAAQPGSTSRLLIISATHTYQAYNTYGGKSLYPSDSPLRSYHVSFDRPYAADSGLGSFTRWEKPFIEWMRNSGRAFEVATDTDLQDATLLTPYNLVVIAGHSEYWTAEARRHLEQYSQRGGHIAIFGGNTMWWQARLTDANRRLTVYKNAAADPELGRNNAVVTVNWYAEPVNNPENLITGSSFRHGGYTNVVAYPNDLTPLPASQRTGYTVTEPQHWVFAGTGVRAGDVFGRAAAGTEVDGVVFNCGTDGAPMGPDGSDGTPLNFRILATVPAADGFGTIGIYVNAAGGAVFNAGTRDWPIALSTDPIVARITSNVIDRLVSGERQLFDPVQSSVLTRELFNCPSPMRFLPSWRGSRGESRTSPRCAYEGPGGLELSGAQQVLLSRSFTPTFNWLREVHVRFYVNADGLTGPSGTPLGLLTLQNRREGINTRVARVDVNVTSTGRAVRLNLYAPDGSLAATSPSIALGSGWHSVQVVWRSPGEATLQVGDGARVRVENAHGSQAVSEFMLQFPSDPARANGFVCVDAIAAGTQPLPAM